MADDPGALSGFAAKWAASRPEFALALRFLKGPSRFARIAFACLAFELEHAAFAIADDTVAGAKLAWWAEEFMRLHGGSPQHPLTRELLEHGAADVPVALWQETILAAMGQRDAEPASDGAGLLRGYLALYRPLAAAEARCIGGIDVEAAAYAASVSHAIHACAALDAPAHSNALALPLDLLARHGLSRLDLARPGAARDAALRDHLTHLSGFGRSALASRGAGLVRRTALAADHARAARAGHAAEPLKRLHRELHRLPLAALWTAWRGAGVGARI